MLMFCYVKHSFLGLGSICQTTEFQIQWTYHFFSLNTFHSLLLLLILYYLYIIYKCCYIYMIFIIFIICHVMYRVKCNRCILKSQLVLFFFFFCLFAFSRAAPMAYGGYQARGLIGAVATGLCQHYSNICDLHHSSQQYRILNPLSKARDPNPHHSS